MRTYHAVSQGRTGTRSEPPDAAHTEGTLLPAAHPAAPPAEATARRRRGTLTAGKRVFGPPVARAARAVLGAHIPRACARGRACPCTRAATCEVLTRGDLRRARYRQPVESLFGEGEKHAEDRCVRAHPASCVSGAAGAAACGNHGSEPARLLPRGRLLLRSGADRPGRQVAQDRAVRRLRTDPGAGRAAA